MPLATLTPLQLFFTGALAPQGGGFNPPPSTTGQLQDTPPPPPQTMTAPLGTSYDSQGYHVVNPDWGCWGELKVGGDTNPWPCYSQIPYAYPGGVQYGWKYVSTTLDGQQIVAGNWSATWRMWISSGVGSVTCDVRIQVSGGTGGSPTVELKLSGVVLTSTAQNLTFPATAGVQSNYAGPDSTHPTGARLTARVLVNVLSNTTGDPTTTINFTRNGSFPQITTPGYQPSQYIGIGPHGDLLFATGQFMTLNWTGTFEWHSVYHDQYQGSYTTCNPFPQANYTAYFGNPTLHYESASGAVSFHADHIGSHPNGTQHGLPLGFDFSNKGTSTFEGPSVYLDSYTGQEVFPGDPHETAYLNPGLPNPGYLGYPLFPEVVNPGAIRGAAGLRHQTWDVTGTYTATAEVEILYEIVRGGRSYYYGGQGFGQGADGPPYTQLYIFYRLKVGGVTRIRVGGNVHYTYHEDQQLVDNYCQFYGPHSYDSATDTPIAHDFSDTNNTSNIWIDGGGELAVGVAGSPGLAATVSGGTIVCDMYDTNGNKFSVGSIAGGANNAQGGSITTLPDRKCSLQIRIRDLSLGSFSEAPIAFQVEAASSATGLAPDAPYYPNYGWTRAPQIAVASGPVTSVFVGQRWRKSSHVDQSQYEAPINEFRNVRVLLLPDNLIASGDDAADIRCVLMGKKYDSFTLQHNGTLTLDDGTNAAPWAAGANTTITTTGTALQAVVSGAGTGSLTRAIIAADLFTVDPLPAGYYGGGTKYQEWAGHRYLRVVVQSVTGSNRPMTLVVTSPYPKAYLSSRTPITKTYDFTTGAAGQWKTVDIDLCRPTTITGGLDSAQGDYRGDPAGFDSRDSCYPIDSGDGELFGVSWVSQYQFTNLAASETYLIDNISLERTTSSSVTFMPARNMWYGKKPTYKDSVNRYSINNTNGPFQTRTILGLTDGKQSLDEAYIWTTARTDLRVSPDPIIDYNIRKLSHLIADINAHPAYTATPAAQFDVDGWSNNDLSCAHAWGGGATYDYTRYGPGQILPAWIEGMDADCRTPLNVQAQWQIDEINWPSMIGNFFAYSGSSADLTSPLVVATNKILRAGVQGLVFDPTGAPLPSEPVTATEVGTGKAAGKGATDTKGYYRTGPPYGGASDGYRLYPAPNVAATNKYSIQVGDNALVETWYPRKFQRASFTGTRINPPTTMPWLFETAHGTMFACAVQKDNDLYIWRSDSPLPPFALSAVRITTGQTITDPRIGYDERRQVILLYVSGGNVLEQISRDEGLTWTAPVTRFAGATKPDLGISPDGETVVRGCLSGSQALLQVQRTGDPNPLAASAALDNTGVALVLTAAESFHIACGPRSASWYLHCRISGEAASSLWQRLDPDSGVSGGLWTRVSGWGITGCSKPTVCVGTNGDLVLAGLVGTTLSIQAGYPGSLSPAVTGIAQNAVGVNLSLQTTGFHIMQGYETAGRLCMIASMTGEVQSSFWGSANWGLKWDRIT